MTSTLPPRIAVSTNISETLRELADWFERQPNIVPRTDYSVTLSWHGHYTQPDTDCADTVHAIAKLYDREIHQAQTGPHIWTQVSLHGGPSSADHRAVSLVVHGDRAAS